MSYEEIHPPDFYTRHMAVSHALLIEKQEQNLKLKHDLDAERSAKEFLIGELEKLGYRLAEPKPGELPRIEGIDSGP